MINFDAKLALPTEKIKQNCRFGMGNVDFAQSERERERGVCKLVNHNTTNPTC